MSIRRRPVTLVLAFVVVAAACGRQSSSDGEASIASLATATTVAEDAATTTSPDTAPLDTAPAPSEPPSTSTEPPTTTTATMPRWTGDVYASTGAGMLTGPARTARPLVYVPHEVSGDTYVIDPATFHVIDVFPSGAESQHVVPSWDLSTLYVVSGVGNRLTPIDPQTGRPGRPIPVDDPYNLYFLPDGSEAIVVVEGHQRLDFVDPHTFARHSSIQTACPGINHIDFAGDGSYFIATCEFEGSMIKVDVATKRVVAKIMLDMSAAGRRPGPNGAQPQDVRVAPDGHTFYVASLTSDGVYVVDGDRFAQTGFVPAGVGTHGLYPSRDGTKLYVVNRGTDIVGGPPHGQGSISVLDFATATIVANWPIPGGGSPDMGNVTADGSQLWLGGRYDGVVYVFDTTSGAVLATIPVGRNPHGLTVWPQPGRYSLGHTGNMR
jgi:YVTN family beta-propeller protein